MLKDKNYYQKLDEENFKNNKTMVQLTMDRVFKSFFSRNPDFLKEFLILQLNLDMDKNTTKITISNNELPTDIKDEYQKKLIF